MQRLGMRVSTTGFITYEHVCASLHVADNLAEPIAEVGCVAEGGDLEEGRIGLGRPGPGVPNVEVVSTAVAQRKRNPRVGRLVVVVGIVPLNQPLCSRTLSECGCVWMCVCVCVCGG